MGELYLDLFGTQRAINHKTGEVCEFTCYQRGWNGKDAFKLDGVIKDSSGKDIWELYGTWNEAIFARHKETKET